MKLAEERDNQLRKSEAARARALENNDAEAERAQILVDMAHAYREEDEAWLKGRAEKERLDKKRKQSEMAAEREKEKEKEAAKRELADSGASCSSHWKGSGASGAS